MSRSASGTEGYLEEAEFLFRQYESFSFTDVHHSTLHLFPTKPALILDIGAGTGRDAAALAAMGHRVVAVEPTTALRERAALQHPLPGIEWLDDSLPELRLVRGRGGTFEVILLSAVWMHLDAGQRRHAMPNVAALLRTGGVMIMTLRHGPVPPGRRMFEVSADETIGLARAENLVLLLHRESDEGAGKHPDVSWTRLAFKRPA